MKGTALDTPEDDWLCHKGNIHYARNRSDFESYQAIDSPWVVLADVWGGLRSVPVLGIGTIRLNVRRQLERPGGNGITLLNVHHIPSAMCNGVSFSRLQDAGVVLHHADQELFWFTKGGHGDSIMCGSDASGRGRIFAVGEDVSMRQPEHFTVGGIVSFSAEPTSPTRLTSRILYPSKEALKRSLYFTPCPLVLKEGEDFFASPLLAQNLAYYSAHGAHFAGLSDNPSHSKTAADDIPEKEFWDAYRKDPDRLEHKRREKREREEALDDQHTSRKSQKLDPYACCKHPTTLPDVYYTQRSGDWLIHNGNVNYVNNRDAFVSFKRLDAFAHVVQTFSDGQAPQTKHIAIAGVGMTEVILKRQLGHKLTRKLKIHETLFIPGAACNGLSSNAFQQTGHWFKENKKSHGHRWTILTLDGQEPVACGNSSSGRRRLLLAGQNDLIDETQHMTLGQLINISADLGYLFGA